MTLRNIKIHKRIIQILPLLILIAFCTKPAHAQGNLSIGVAPTSKVIQIKPGETYSDDVVFWNLSDDADTYNIYIRGFKQIDNQPGTAIVLTEEEDSEDLYSASSWVKTEQQEVKLEPNKNTKIHYSVTVPKDATNGEYTADIFLVSKTLAEGSGARTFANLASGMPILIKIGDEFVENAELLRFTTENNVYEKVNVDFYTKIKNLGDTHITPSGEIVIQNIFNQEVARIPFNSNKQSLLRDNIGNYVDNWSYSGYLSPNKKLMVGPMKASLIVTYRSFQPGFATLTAQTNFWIIPWKLLAALLSAIIVIVVVVIARKKISKRR